MVSIFTVPKHSVSVGFVNSPAIQEINDWLAKPEHSNEFVLLYINDETSDSDWGKIRLIQEPVANITRDILFTPSDKKKSYPDRW